MPDENEGPGGHITLDLGGGVSALVSSEDAHLAHWKWKVRVGKNVYASRTVKKVKTVYLHRSVIGMIPKGFVVDHINGDPLDCRRENLRVVTPSVNARNRRPNRTPTASRFMGVWKKGNRFRADIMVEGKKIALGGYATEEDANKARMSAEWLYWGIEPQRAASYEEARNAA